MIRFRFTAIAIADLITAAGCGGNNAGVTPASFPGGNAPAGASRTVQDASGALADGGFESGGTATWTNCGTSSTQATVQTTTVYAGTYAMQAGSTSSEPNGTSALCQSVTVPSGSPSLTFYTYESTNETSTKYADQELSIRNSSGTVLDTLYKGLSNSGWTQRTYSMSAYAGQTVTIYFGVSGTGASGYNVRLNVDNVAWSGGSTPVPTATPTATAAPTATAKPTATPIGSTPTPTAKPTATPTAAPTSSATPAPAYTCNDTQFTTYQSEFAAGSISADQFVDVCGKVEAVTAATKTSNGLTHAYWYIALPSGYNIEIVSDLTAMAEASTDKPPTWPWVAVGDYAYAQGRYYYDNSSSQGIDWTEDDTSSSWEHDGYVAICNSAGASCSKYW